MTARASSIAACRDIHDSGIATGQYAVVMQAVRSAQNSGREDITRREISREADMETSSVAGRVNKLVEVGALVERPARKCSITGRTVVPVAIPSNHEED